MRHRFTTIILFVAILHSCGSIFGINRVSPKQPEPTQPQIGGEILGVLDGTRIRIQAERADGSISWGNLIGNSPWFLIIRGESGDDSKITAEAEGFISIPEFYVVRKIDEKAYVIENGQITDRDPTKLNFIFSPIPTSTPSIKQ